MATNDHDGVVSEALLESLPVGADMAELAREVERLTRNAVTDRPACKWTASASVFAQILRPGDQLVIRDLEHLDDAPRLPRGTATVYDAPSFVTLVGRLGTPNTTLWAQQPSTGAPTPRIVAIFDDHAGPDDPGWREQRATLEVRVDPDWKAWAARDAGAPGGVSAWMNQVTLAEFLTDQMHNIVEPRAAELIGAVTTFATKRNVTFQQSVKLDSGEQQFTYIERDDEAGTVTLPQKLSLNVRPFYGADPVVLEVAIRYRISKEGGLSFGLFRIRPDRAEEAAWETVCGLVAAELPEHPLLQGAAPAPLRGS